MFNSFSTLQILWFHCFGNLILINQFGFINFAAAAFAVWEIWKHRYSVLFDNQRLNCSKVVYKVMHRVAPVVSFYNHELAMSMHDQVCIFDAQLRIIPVDSKVGKWIKWYPLTFGYKLNTDSSCINNIPTCGGIIRDSSVLVSLIYR